MIFLTHFHSILMIVLPEWEIGQLAGLPKNKGVQIWIIIQIDKRLVFWKGKFTASAEKLRSHLGIWRFRVDISEFRSVISEFRSVISESIEILKIGTLSLKVRIRTQVQKEDPCLLVVLLSLPCGHFYRENGVRAWTSRSKAALWLHVQIFSYWKQFGMKNVGNQLIKCL